MQKIGVADSDQYTVAIENDGDGNPIYVGQAIPAIEKGGVGWRIKKITWASGNPTDVQWADGVNTFNKVWDSRSGYAYS